MTTLFSYGIWLSQSNSDSKRPAPTFWSIFSFMDDALAASTDVNHWCLNSSGNWSSLESGYFINYLALVGNWSDPSLYACWMCWLTSSSRMFCLLTSSLCSTLFWWFHISHAIIIRWVNNAIVHHWLDFQDLNAFQNSSCSLHHHLAKHSSRARPQPMLSWICPAIDHSVFG